METFEMIMFLLTCITAGIIGGIMYLLGKLINGFFFMKKKTIYVSTGSQWKFIEKYPLPELESTCAREIIITDGNAIKTIWYFEYNRKGEAIYKCIGKETLIIAWMDMPLPPNASCTLIKE